MKLRENIDFLAISYLILSILKADFASFPQNANPIFAMNFICSYWMTSVA